MTCGKTFPRTGIGSIQAGHFPELAGRTNAVLFVEEAVHGQCYQCNHHKYGNPKPYMLFMQRTYGQRLINKLIIESHQTVIYQKWEYDKLAEIYKTKTEKLLHDRD